MSWDPSRLHFPPFPSPLQTSHQLLPIHNTPSNQLPLLPSLIFPSLSKTFSPINSPPIVPKDDDNLQPETLSEPQNETKINTTSISIPKSSAKQLKQLTLSFQPKSQKSDIDQAPAPKPPPKHPVDRRSKQFSARFAQPMENYHTRLMNHREASSTIKQAILNKDSYHNLLQHIDDVRDSCNKSNITEQETILDETIQSHKEMLVDEEKQDELYVPEEFDPNTNFYTVSSVLSAKTTQISQTPISFPFHEYTHLSQHKNAENLDDNLLNETTHLETHPSRNERNNKTLLDSLGEATTNITQKREELAQITSVESISELVHSINWSDLMYPVSIQRDPMIVRVKKPDPSKALFGTTIGFGSPPHGNNDGDDENEQGDDLGSSDDSDDSDFEDRLLDQPMNIRRAERKIQRTGADDGRVTSVLALSVRLNWMKQDTKFPSSFLMTSTDNLVTPNEATIWDHFQDVNYKPALVVVVSAQKPTKRFKNFKLFHFHRDESSFTFSGIFNKTSAVVDALHPFRKDPLVDYDVDDDDEWEEEKETVMASDEWKSEQKAIKAKAAREEAKRKRKEKRRLEKEAAKAAQKRPDEQRDDDEVDLDEDSSSSDLNPNLDEYETDEDEQFEAVSPRVSRTHINTIFGAGLQEDSSEDDSDFTDEGSSDGSSASDMEDGDFEQGMMKDEELEHHQPTPSHTPQGNTAQKRRVFVEDDSEEYETMITPTTGKRTQLRIIQDDDDSDSDAIDNYSSEDLAKSPPLELFSQSTSDQMKSDPDPKAQTTEFLRSFLSMFDSEPKAHPKTSLSPSPTPKDIGADSSFSYSTKQFEKEGATQALRLLKNDTERMRSTKKDSFIDESDDSEKTGRMIGSLLFYRSKCSIMTQMQIISVSKNYDMDDRQIKYVQKTRVPVAVMHTQQTDNSDPSSSHQRIPLEQIPLSLDQTQSSQTGWKYVVQDQPKNIPVQDGDAHAFFSLLKTLSNYSIIPIPKSEQKRKERAKRNLEKEQQRREKEERKMERLRLREEKKQQELTPKLVLSSLPGTGLNYTVSLPISQTLTNPLSPFSSQLTSAVSRIPKSAMRLLKGDMLKEFVRMADGTKHRDAVFDLFEQKHPLYKNRLRRVKLQHILKSVMFKSKDKKYRVCREFRTQFGLDELDEEEEGDSDFLKDERELPDFILTALEEEEPPIEPLDSFLDKEKEESGEMGPTELSHSLKAHANCSLIPLESLTMPELLHLRNQCVQIFRLIETLDAINGNRKWKEMEQLNDPVLISEGEKVRENGHIIPQVAVSSEPLVNSAFLSPYAFTPAVLGTDSNAGVDGDTTPNENSPTSSPKLSNGNMSTLPTKNVTFILPDLLSTLLHPTKKTGFGVVGQDEMTTPANTTELVPEKKEEQPIKRRSSHTHSSTRNRATGITPPASEETAKDKQIKSLERSIRAKKLDLKRALALGIDTTELELTLEQDFSEMNQLVQVSPKLEQEVVAPPVIDKDTPPTQPAIEPRPVQPPPVTALMSVLEPPRPVPKPKEKKRITPIKME